MQELTLGDRAKALLTPSGRSDVPPFMVMDVMAAAARIEAAGGHVIHMEVGQPAAAAPKVAIAAAHAALDAARIDYTSRSAFHRYVRESPDTTAILTDVPSIPRESRSRRARPANFILAFLSMFEPGDRVAVTVPGYPPYRHILTALGCEPVLIETTNDMRHALTGEALLAAHRKAPLKGVLVGNLTPMHHDVARGSPARFVRRTSAGIRFISDEIYHGLDYAFPAVTAAELSSQAMVINSFSKYFCMTGWRVGWMVVPEPLVRPIERLQQNLSISVPTLSQIAAEAAFEGADEMEAIKRGYQENRRILIEGLPEAGLTNSARGRRVLPLRRRFGFHLRQFRVCRPHAGEGACGGNARRRLRSDPRPRLHPLLLCALGRRDARSGDAHRALARIAPASLLSTLSFTAINRRAIHVRQNHG